MNFIRVFSVMLALLICGGCSRSLPDEEFNTIFRRELAVYDYALTTRSDGSKGTSYHIVVPPPGGDGKILVSCLYWPNEDPPVTISAQPYTGTNDTAGPSLADVRYYKSGPVYNKRHCDEVAYSRLQTVFDKVHAALLATVKSR